MDARRWWIVGHDDKAWGPFEKAQLSALIAEGKSRSDGLVCPEGEARWVPLASVSDLAEIPWPPRPATPAAPAPHAAVAGVQAGTPTGGATCAAEPSGRPAQGADRSAQPAAATFSYSPAPASGAGAGAGAALRLNELHPIPGWPTILLSVVTLGLWGLFCFYRTLRVYRRLSEAPASNGELLFWIFTGILGFVLLFLLPTVGFTWFLMFPAVIVGAFLLRETLRLRDGAIQRLVPGSATQPGLYPAVRSDDWHFGLWITGSVLTLTVFGAIVGVPILVAQALAWFEDWNRLAALARARTAPMGSPAAPYAVA